LIQDQLPFTTSACDFVVAEKKKSADLKGAPVDNVTLME
jgi:hypothetical protein